MDEVTDLTQSSTEYEHTKISTLIQSVEDVIKGLNVVLLYVSFIFHSNLSHLNEMCTCFVYLIAMLASVEGEDDIIDNATVIVMV